jgi:hypothetical protein
MMTYEQFQTKTGLTGTALIAGWKKYYQAEDRDSEEQPEEEPCDCEGEEDCDCDQEGEDDVTETEQKKADAKLQHLRASRGNGSPGYMGANSKPTDRQAVIEASLLMSIGNTRGLEQFYGPQTLNRATEIGNRGASLHTLFANAFAASGERAPTRWGPESVRRALQFSASGPSTASVAGILSNVANKRLMMSFGEAPSSWRAFCKADSAKDFKDHKGYRLILNDQVQPVAASGELKHLSLSDETYTNRLATLGGLIGIDRRDMINDDLSSFATLTAALGRNVGTVMEKLAVTALLSGVNNSAFWHSSHSNYLTTGSALGLTTLGTAYKAVVEQKDATNTIIGAIPSVLLVPPALFPTALSLAHSTEIITGSDTTVPSGNPWAGKVTVAVSPMMGAAGGLGGSDTNWSLMVPSSDLSPVSVLFLNGRENPTIETAEMDFDRLGISLRTYHDVGFALLDYRGSAWATGAGA